MRLAGPTLVLFLTLAGAAVPSAGASEFVLFKNTWGNVIVATDVTPAGREQVPPTPQQPVYYKGLSLGRRLGSIPGDREPDERRLDLFVAEVLAKQGFRAAQPGGPEPTLLLVLQWGYVTPGSENLLWFLGYKPEQDIAAPSPVGLLGPEVFRRGMRSQLTDTLLQDAQNPLYGVIVTAFEFKSARTPNPVAYWQTRIGIPAAGKSMAEALPVIVAAAGPAIGRPSDQPVMLDTDRMRDGQVKLGELQFLEVVGDHPATPAGSSGPRK